MAQDHLRPWALHLNNLVKDHWATLHTKFQASKTSGSKEEDFLNIFSMYFYSLNLGPLAWGHLELWDLPLNKIGIGPLGNATYPMSGI